MRARELQPIIWNLKIEYFYKHAAQKRLLIEIVELLNVLAAGPQRLMSNRASHADA